MIPLLAPLMVAFSSVCFASATLSIDIPNFAGQWARDAKTAERPSVAATGDADFPRGEMGTGWGTPLSITQDPNRLTVEFPYFSAYDLQPPLRFVYALDGTVSRNQVMIGHSPIDTQSRATWVGDTLVIATVTPGPVGADARALTTEVRQTMVLLSPTRLRVEVTRTGPAGARATTSTATYTKR